MDLGSRGFSLVEGMIALALVATIGLAAAQLGKMLTHSNQSTELNVIAEKFDQDVLALMDSEASCSQNVVGSMDPSTLNDIVLNDLRAADGQVLYSVTSSTGTSWPYFNGKLRPIDFRIRFIGDPSIGYEADFVYSYEVKRDAGIKRFTRRLALYVNVEVGTGQLSCSSSTTQATVNFRSELCAKLGLGDASDANGCTGQFPSCGDSEVLRWSNPTHKDDPGFRCEGVSTTPNCAESGGILKGDGTCVQISSSDFGPNDRCRLVLSGSTLSLSCLSLTSTASSSGLKNGELCSMGGGAFALQSCTKCENGFVTTDTHMVVGGRTIRRCGGGAVTCNADLSGVGAPSSAECNDA